MANSISSSQELSTSNPLLTPISTSTFSLSSYLPSISRKLGTSSYIIAPFKTSSPIANTSTSPLSPSQQQSISSISSIKRWRWWNFLGIFIFLLIVTEIVMIFSSYKLLHQELFPIRIGKTYLKKRKQNLYLMIHLGFF